MTDPHGQYYSRLQYLELCPTLLPLARFQFAPCVDIQLNAIHLPACQYPCESFRRIYRVLLGH